MNLNITFGTDVGLLFCQVKELYDVMQKEAKQSQLETQAARDEVSQLHQTVHQLQLLLQVGGILESVVCTMSDCDGDGIGCTMSDCDGDGIGCF